MDEKSELMLVDIDGRIVADWTEGLEPVRAALETAYPVADGVIGLSHPAIPVILYRLRVLLGRT